MNYHKSQKRVNGRFATDAEPAVCKLTVRVPPSLREEVEQMANGKVADWLREAIAEKIAREQLQHSLHRLLRSLQKDMSVDTVTLLLPIENQQNLAVQATIGLEEEIEQKIRIPLGYGIAGRIALIAQPIIVNDLSKVEVVSPVLRQRGLRSLIGIPVPIKQGVFGVLHVGMFQSRQFNEHDIKQLEVAARQIAPIIAGAERFSLKLSYVKLENCVHLFWLKLTSLVDWGDIPLCSVHPTLIASSAGFTAT